MSPTSFCFPFQVKWMGNAILIVGAGISSNFRLFKCWHYQLQSFNISFLPFFLFVFVFFVNCLQNLSEKNQFAIRLEISCNQINRNHVQNNDHFKNCKIKEFMASICLNQPKCVIASYHLRLAIKLSHCLWKRQFGKKRECTFFSKPIIASLHVIDWILRHDQKQKKLQLKIIYR